MSIYSIPVKIAKSAWIPSLDFTGNETATLNDLAGNNHGTLINMDPSTDWVDDSDAGGARALEFDGVNDYVDAGGAADLFGDTMAISFWCKGVPQSDRVIVGFGNSSSATMLYGIGTGDGTNTSRLRVFIRSDSGNTFNTFVGFPFNDTWKHVVAVSHENALKVYIDNVLEFHSASYRPSGGFTFNMFGIGARLRNSIGAYFSGRIDDVRFFQDELNSYDVAYLYGGGLGRGVVTPFNLTKTTARIVSPDLVGGFGA
jgi:hypothetical protein